jgi:hypothetical protein
MAIVRRFTAHLLSGCLCVVPCCCDAGLRKEMFRGDCTTIYNASAVRLPWYVCCVVVLLGWGSRWCVAIVLLFTALLLSSCLGVCAVLLCCWGGGGCAWRLCYYLQHFCCPAALVGCRVAVMLGVGERVCCGDCATIYSTSAVRLPWCVLLCCCVAGVEGRWFVAIVLLFTALLLCRCLGVCAVLLEWKGLRVAIVLLFTALLLSGCLGVVWCVAIVLLFSALLLSGCLLLCAMVLCYYNLSSA